MGTVVVAGDCLEPDSLLTALDGADVAHYLVHSMGSGADFEQQDREAAHNFGVAAKAAGVRRVIYLGGGFGAPPMTFRRICEAGMRSVMFCVRRV